MAQSIADVLGLIRGGYAMHKAGIKLAEVVKAVKETGTAGEISITIKVKPDKTDNRVVTMQPVIKTKIPEKGYAEGILFVDDNGKLSKEDPKQLDMLAERDAENVRSMERSEAALNQIGRG